jgi:hypothetical protein
MLTEVHLRWSYHATARLSSRRSPGRLNRLALAVTAFARASAATPLSSPLSGGTEGGVAALSPGLRTPPSLAPVGGSGDARLGRVRLAEQPVVSLFQGTTATRAASWRTKPLLGRTLILLPDLRVKEPSIIGPLQAPHLQCDQVPPIADFPNKSLANL